MPCSRAMASDLPIHAIRAEFESAFAEGPVVVSSPTGSGKSTELPRWLAERGHRVVVVEPRRVACRTLAARVAELEGSPVGETVGYQVRDEAVRSDATRILFATPGIVLRSRELLARTDVVVLDELHERSLEIDLLLAMLARPDAGPSPRLVAMSATLDGDRVARHVRGRHVAASGRTFPVAIHTIGSGMPSTETLVDRVMDALGRASRDPGDVLVFLPGKGEIDACLRRVDTRAFDAMPLHGALSVAEQRRAFAPSKRRKVVFATNVAETSVTIPGVGVVIDSGLVRRTRYHEGRSYLAITPIAEDAATQRAGRAGRTGPGVAYRLWGAAAKLAESTPPEIHRESLVPLVMHAASWELPIESLAFLDPPKPFAIAAAREALARLGAIDGSGRITARGTSMATLPIAPDQARLLVEAQSGAHPDHALDDAIDLVAALSVGRPLLVRTGSDRTLVRDDDCDASALVRAMRVGGDDDPDVVFPVLVEARRTRARLRAHFDRPETPPRAELDRPALVRLAIAADPRSAHVTRTRGNQVAFANGGTELELGRETLLARGKPPEAIVVFESRALGAGLDARIVVTIASPTTLDGLARAGLGEESIARISVERGVVTAELERSYAGRTIGSREAVPTGALAREAIATLFLRGSLFRESRNVSEERLALANLAAKLGPAVVGDEVVPEAPDLPSFVAKRLLTLGIESGEDLALLSPADLLAPDLPYLVRTTLERDHPRTVSVGDATYRADYDLDARRVTLVLVRGQRKDPPPLAYLPKFPGLGIVVSSPAGTKVLRPRG